MVINGEGEVTKTGIAYREAFNQNPKGFVPNEIMVGTPGNGKWVVESVTFVDGVYLVKLKKP